MDLDRILELLAKQIGNVATDSELTELQALLQKHPEHRHLVAILQAIQAKKLRQPSQNEEVIVKEGWDKLQKKLASMTEAPAIEREEGAPVKRIPFFFRLNHAALWIGLVVLCGLALWFGLLRNSPAENSAIAKAQQIIVPNGKPEQKLLPDGSTVWVNAGSEIQYITNTTVQTREIFLKGEAYFKVKHDPAHPFIVHAGNISVRALGTEFNVSAYPGESKVETTLINGKVQVTMQEKPEQKIILVPNEKLTVTKKMAGASPGEGALEEVSYRVGPVETSVSGNAVKEVVWMQDRLAFQNEPFGNLVKRMERRFNVHIHFVDESLKMEALTGTFENENIQKALRLLQMTTPFRYKINGDSVYLSRQGL